MFSSVLLRSKHPVRGLIVMVLQALLVAEAAAALVRVDFEGAITSVRYTEVDPAPGSIVVGDPFAGALIYDDTALLSTGGGTSARFNEAVRSFELRVAGQVFDLTPGPSPTGVLLDSSFARLSADTGDVLGGLNFIRAACTGNDCLSLAALDLSDRSVWSRGVMAMYGLNGVGIFGDGAQTRIDGSLGAWTVNQVTTPVPEPATLTLMLVGLGALALGLRRR